MMYNRSQLLKVRQTAGIISQIYYLIIYYNSYIALEINNSRTTVFVIAIQSL